MLQDYVTPEMITALVGAFGSVLIALAAYGANLAKTYIASKASENSFAFLKAQAATAVKWLEQSPAFSGAEGAQKKEAAVVYLMKAAESIKIPLTHEMADKLIEEAVFDTKKRLDDLVELTAATATQG
jgi:hypothetical protein